MTDSTPATAASEYGLMGDGNGVCPTCSEAWTASPANVGPRPPGLECPDRWHIDNYPDDDDDDAIPMRRQP